MTADEARSEAARLWILAGARQDWRGKPPEVIRELDLILRWLHRQVAGNDKTLAKVLERETGRQVKLLDGRATTKAEKTTKKAIAMATAQQKPPTR